MHDGWEVAGGATSIVVPVGTSIAKANEWVDLFIWQPGDLPEGRSILEAEIAAKLPKPRPTDILTRWLRASADGVTKRRTHAIGTIESWADVTTYLELVTNDDLPMTVQMWQKGTLALTVVKVIPKVFTPLAELRWRIR